MKLSYNNFPFLKVFDKDFKNIYKTDLSSLDRADDGLFYIMRDLYINNGIYKNIPIYVMSDEFNSKLMEHRDKMSKLLKDGNIIKGVLKPICIIYKMILWTLFEYKGKYIFAAQNKSGYLWWWIEVKLDENNMITASKDCLYYNRSGFDVNGLLFGFIAILLFKEYAPLEIEVLGKHSKINKSIIKEKCVNDTGIDVTLLDSKWFREIIRTEGFSVSGHFRLQPYKDDNGEWKRKFIYINEFEKHGYHRHAIKNNHQIYI